MSKEYVLGGIALLVLLSMLGKNGGNTDQEASPPVRKAQGEYEKAKEDAKQAIEQAEIIFKKCLADASSDQNKIFSCRLAHAGTNCPNGALKQNGECESETPLQTGESDKNILCAGIPNPHQGSPSTELREKCASTGSDTKVETSFALDEITTSSELIVQVGEFGSENQAQAKLISIPNSGSGKVVSFLRGDVNIYAVQFGPLSKNAAKELVDKLKHSGINSVLIVGG